MAFIFFFFQKRKINTRLQDPCDRGSQSGR
jgi:hypothetical protein